MTAGSPTAAAKRFGAQPIVYGSARVTRAERGAALPYQVDVGDQVVAGMGWYSWLGIYLGRGQRIEFPSGTRWRLRAMGHARYICPVIVDTAGGKVALATPGADNYNINGRTWAFVLNPADAAGRGRSKSWSLRERETEVALVMRKPRAATCWEPTPLAAVLLSIVVAQMGIPGERELQLPPMWR